MSVTPPWADAPTCTGCDKNVLLTEVPADQDGPGPDVAGVEGMYASEELAALNDSDRPRWLWCSTCGCVDAGPKAYRQAVKADEWWERPDREQAWAEILREREIDRVAAEHAARQLDMFGGGS